MYNSNKLIHLNYMLENQQECQKNLSNITLLWQGFFFQLSKNNYRRNYLYLKLDLEVYKMSFRKVFVICILLFNRKVAQNMQILFGDMFFTLCSFLLFKWHSYPTVPVANSVLDALCFKKYILYPTFYFFPQFFVLSWKPGIFFFQFVYIFCLCMNFQYKQVKYGCFLHCKVLILQGLALVQIYICFVGVELED
eukprot:TRINITY_DN4427_c1_g1_i2.p2 TRINITY_DN4427_c1_g1~~TRINITY_DN4427_c1_g1_i2.p2  ORF type:complete len:194 (+),score=-9.73 TRINITY_DN4427_c1_g1_i2:538-1119(+)